MHQRLARSVKIRSLTTAHNRIMSIKLVETRTIFDPIKRIWRGPKWEIKAGPEVSLGRSLVDALRRHPEHINQICDNNGRQYSNKDIEIYSIRVAQNLEKLGIQQEDVIGICAANTDFLAPLFIGAVLNGAIVATLDPSFDKDGIRHTFALTRPKLMFCDGNDYNSVKGALTKMSLDIPIYTMKDHLEGVQQIGELITSTGREKNFTPKSLKLGSSQTAAILCSSGTTGLPKGVCMSHESILNTNVFIVSPGEKLLCFSTLYWLSGLLILALGILQGATRVITDQAYTPELFLRIIEQYKLELAFTPPSQMAMAVQSPDCKTRDLSSLQLYLCSGGAVPLSVIQTFSKHANHCQVSVGYGMSEIVGTCCFGVCSKPGANGQLLPNMEVKVIDESGKRLCVGESGEVCLKTPFKWAGYYGDVSATKMTYDDEGWIHSGDIGYFDEDGSLLIIDRKKDILKSVNYIHFFPTEIEEVIMQIPDVVEACVCGIPDPDTVSSFLPAAVVIKLSSSKLTEDEVSSFVANRMAHYKHLRGGVYFVDSLPKTASGKNIRAEATTIVEALWEQRRKCNGNKKSSASIPVSA